MHNKERPSIEHVSRRGDRQKLADNELRSSGDTSNKTHTKSDPSSSSPKERNAKLKMLKMLKTLILVQLKYAGSK